MGIPLTKDMQCLYIYADTGDVDDYAEDSIIISGYDKNSESPTSLTSSSLSPSSSLMSYYSPNTVARLSQDARTEREKHKVKVKLEKQLLDELVKKDNEKILREDKDFQEILKMGQDFLRDIQTEHPPTAQMLGYNLMRRNVDALHVKHLYLFRTMKRVLVEASEDFLCEVTILVSSFIDDDLEAKKQNGLKPWVMVEIESMRLGADAVVRYTYSTK